MPTNERAPRGTPRDVLGHGRAGRGAGDHHQMVTQPPRKRRLAPPLLGPSMCSVRTASPTSTHSPSSANVQVPGTRTRQERTRRCRLGAGRTTSHHRAVPAHGAVPACGHDDPSMLSPDDALVMVDDTGFRPKNLPESRSQASCSLMIQDGRTPSLRSPPQEEPSHALQCAQHPLRLGALCSDFQRARRVHAPSSTPSGAAAGQRATAVPPACSDPLTSL